MSTIYISKKDAESLSDLVFRALDSGAETDENDNYDEITSSWIRLGGLAIKAGAEYQTSHSFVKQEYPHQSNVVTDAAKSLPFDAFTVICGFSSASTMTVKLPGGLSIENHPAFIEVLSENGFTYELHPNEEEWLLSIPLEFKKLLFENDRNLSIESRYTLLKEKLCDKILFCLSSQISGQKNNIYWDDKLKFIGGF